MVLKIMAKHKTKKQIEVWANEITLVWFFTFGNPFPNHLLLIFVKTPLSWIFWENCRKSGVSGEFLVKIIPFWNQAAENAAKLRRGREGKNSKNNSTEKTTKLLIVIVILFLVAEFPMVMRYLLLKSILRVAYFGILILCKRGLKALMNSEDLERNFDWKILNGAYMFTSGNAFLRKRLEVFGGMDHTLLPSQYGAQQAE